MTDEMMTGVILLGSALGGFLGALTGLGGGVIVVPLLVLGFGVNMKYAVGASLVSVIATSSGAAAAYVREGLTNVRIGMLLESATTTGALAGAFLSTFVPTQILGIMFGVFLIISAYLAINPAKHEDVDLPPDELATKLKLDGSYPSSTGEEKHYGVRNVPGGFSIMFVAGITSALLGIGSGALKVLAMDRVMRIPFKVSTTTSNFMIGVTGATSVGVYLKRGYIDPCLAMPVTLGVLCGSLIAAKILPGSKSQNLRILFAIVVFIVGLQMIYKAATGKI